MHSMLCRAEPGDDAWDTIIKIKLRLPTFIKQVMCARYFSECSLCINSFNSILRQMPHLGPSYG